MRIDWKLERVVPCLFVHSQAYRSRIALRLALVLVTAPAYATVQIVTMTPAPAPPQFIGTPVAWTVTATDTNPGPLTFQFSVKTPTASGFSVVRDFNVGTLSAGIWTSQPFVWVPTGVEGMCQIQVVVKDFTFKESMAMKVAFQVNPLVTGSAAVAVPTANPLVALFSAPACAAGSSMRVGPMTVFDNGNTRISPPPVGLGSGFSRGMALTIDETAMQVTPVLSQDLGVQSFGDGSAQLLSDGHYFFMVSDVLILPQATLVTYNIELTPTAGTTSGTQVLNVQAPQVYRAWRMPSLYGPPTI